MGQTELSYIHSAFEQNWIAPVGPNIDGFENDLANYTDVPYIAALSSGISAIHLALIILGVSTGDEVICQSMTFSASANPIIYQGEKDPAASHPGRSGHSHVVPHAT